MNEPWPKASEIDQVFDLLYAQAMAELDSIEGIPHIVRVVSDEPGSKQARDAELFFNWLLTQ